MTRPATDRPGLYPLLFLLVISTAALALWIATNTRANAHPDEYVQADAFCYFETHLWPPPLNQDGLRYSPYGWSRVYTGEVVYLLFGQIGGRLRAWLPPEPPPVVSNAPAGPHRLLLPLISSGDLCALDYTIYRRLNVGLWVVSLSALLWVGRRQSVVRGLALLLAGLPQVVYLYGYANSDAWSLSVASLLFVYAWTQRARATVARRDVAILGGLVGLVLLAKQPLWLSIPFSLAVWLARPAWVRPHIAPGLGRIAAWLAGAALVAFLVALPLHGVYPLTQPAYAQQVTAMREQRARGDLRPSAPTYAGYRMAAQGLPPSAVLTREWVTTTLESFYGRFGYLEIRLPGWVYATAAALLAMGVGLTVVDFVRRRRAYTWQERALLALTPLCLALPVAASLYNSWTVDLQPQGRYLYAAIFPLAYLLSGVSASEPALLRRSRTVIWVALLVLGHYALVMQFGPAQALR